jgi:hypothetical protein
MGRTLRSLQEAHFKSASERANRQAAAVLPGADRIDWDALPSVSKLREAVGESSFPQLLRAGVQNFLFDGYNAPDVIYPDIVRVVNSDKRQELYAPLYQGELPVEVFPGEPFPESDMQGMDQQIVNRKFGRMLAFERELVDDDQTGQIQQKASIFGERMRVIEEIQTMNAIFGSTLADGTTSLYSSSYGDNGNYQSGGGRITEASLKAADIALRLMKDPMNQRMLVNPTHLIHSVADKFDVAVLLKSLYHAATPQSSAGSTGSYFSVNPLEGLYSALYSPWVPNGAADTTQGTPASLDGTNGGWILMEPAKGVVFQDRDPLEVVNENPASGEGFEHEVFRYRIRRRFAVGVIEPRFQYRGN